MIDETFSHTYIWNFPEIVLQFLFGRLFKSVNFFETPGNRSTQSSADALIVALLWKLLQMPSCSTNNANLDKTNFDMFYKIDYCATIHGRIWMNNVPN